MADQFIRVRLAAIEGVDLSVFQFDLDMTFAVFFLNARQKVYGRYGARDAKNAEHRMSLAGLRFAMQAALDTHRQETRQSEPGDPVQRPPARFIHDYASARRYRGCIHCHQAKEIINSERQRAGQWTRQDLWRYPLPDNLGLVLDVDQGNLVRQVVTDSAAHAAGIQTGDVVLRIAQHPIHSLADATYALDQAPESGSLPIAWSSGEQSKEGTLELHPGWRKSDISWRPSMLDLLPYLPLHGTDLTEQQKIDAGLTGSQLAYRQRDPAPDRVLAAGIRPGDIIVGIDKQLLENLDAAGFRQYVRRNFLAGDVVTIELLRDGQRLSVPMKLSN